MSRLLVGCMALLLVCFACNDAPKSEPPPVQEPEIAPIAAVFEAYYEDYLKLFPLEATSRGDYRYNDQLPNELSVAHRNALRSFYQNYLEKLGEYDISKLSAEDQLSYEVMKWECEMKLEEMAFPTHLTPLNQFHALHLIMGQLASGSGSQPFNTVKDYEDWLKRVTAFTNYLDTAQAYMRQGIEQGYVLPTALAEKVVPQFGSLAGGEVDDHLYFTPARNFPDDFSEADRSRLDQAYREMVAEEMMPAFAAMQTFLEQEYVPACRSTSGISDTPDGANYYQSQIKHYTTTLLTASEVFDIGQQEVERLTAEMEKVKAEVGFKGTLAEFFEHLRHRKELMPFTEASEVIANFNRIHEVMKPHLEQLFDQVPKSKFEVRQTEAFREKSASAEYNLGTIDGSRPGIFYVPVPEPTKYNILSDEDLFLHEAIPGHHYQASLQQENTDLPEFRKRLWYSSYGEGWALYSESLGKELGLYEDPYQYFGMLSAEMHRAIRLVVDVGMHSKGWTREEAIAYSLAHEAEAESSIVAEIERYMSWPGQALSYKIGQLKIRELRARAEEKLQERFDIREFHNEVLRPGCVPLAVLEQEIDRWIAEKRAPL